MLCSTQMVPIFVLDVLGVLPGLPGLFMACVFSASLRYSTAVRMGTS